MMKAMQDLEKSLPFKILGFDTDNGSEFLNYRLLKYFKERPSKGRVYPFPSLSEK